MVVPHLPPSPRLSPRNLCLSRGRWLDQEEEGGCLSHADAGVLQGIFSTILTKVKVRGRRKAMDKINIPHRFDPSPSFSSCF